MTTQFINEYLMKQNALQTEFQLLLYKYKDDFSSIKAHFTKSCITVKVNIVGVYKIYNIKYTGLCTFTEDWHHASRGSTFVVLDNKIIDSIYAFNKFFNLHEYPNYMGITAMDYMKQLESQGFKIVFQNKADGSCIRTWNCEAGIFSTTLGTTSDTNAMQNLEGAPTFWKKSLELIQAKYPKVMEYIEGNPGTTLLSELETPWNRIVTYYENEDIIPFVIVDKTGIPRWDILRNLAPTLFNEDGYPIDSSITTTDTFEEDKATFFTKIDNNPNLGKCPEGAVVYAVKTDSDGRPTVAIPIAKAKRPEYTEKHLNVALNPGSPQDLMNMQTLFIEDKFDDVDSVGREVRVSHIEDFRKALQDMAQEIDNFLPQLIVKASYAISGKQGKKEYAMIINSLPSCLRWFNPFLFKNPDKVNGSTNGYELIMNHLKSEDNGEPCISKYQNKNGLFWWINESKHNKEKKGNNGNKDNKENKEKLENPTIETHSQTNTQTNTQPITKLPVEPPKSAVNITRNIDSEKKFLILSDFDGTLTDQIGNDYNVFDPENIIPFEKTFSMLKSYKIMGADIYVLTGRNKNLTQQIEDYVYSILGFRVPVLARPNEASKIVHKTRTTCDLCTDESNNYGTVIHLEDDITVLNACSNLVNSLNIRYIGHQICGGHVKDIITTTKTSTVVTLVQPPASGKSSTLSRIEKIYTDKGIRVTYVSHDRLVQKWRAENPSQQNPDGSWPRPDGSIIHKVLQKTFNLGIATGGLVIIDMCNDTARMIKSISATNSKTIIGTFVQTEHIKNHKGKMEEKMTEEYKNFCLYNSKNRIESKNTGETTLDKSIVHAEQVINKKIEGCVRQISTRNITRLAKSIVDIDTMVSTLCTQIDKALEDGRVTNNVKAYVGVPVPYEDDSYNVAPTGFYRVGYPHITTEPPSTNLDSFVEQIGTKIECELSEPVMVGDTIGCHAYSEEDSNYHSTLFVKIGKMPSQCGLEMDTVTNNGKNKLPDRYTQFNGYQVYM
mgnify:CR=1 FL=1